MAEYSSMLPMDIGNPARLWKGGLRTNGILMGNVNSRVPAITEGFSRLVVDSTNPLHTRNVMTWGNGLWMDMNEVDTRPGVRHGQAPLAPGKPVLIGVFQFNQGWQASNPIQPYGMPLYSTGNVIRTGLVGYGTAMTHGANPEHYMMYLEGDSTYDDPAVRTVYSDWVTAWKNEASVSRLALFFHNLSGFPVVAPTSASLPAPTGCTFAGHFKVLAQEHERVYFDIDL